VEPVLLIIEDDPSLREVTRLGLEGEGFAVLAAEDGPTGLELFAGEQPDLVLLDVMLPGRDGFDVCREIRKTSLVPIIMLTARSSTVDVIVGLEAGADDYVTKPFEFPVLVARIRSVLRRSSVRVGAADTSRDTVDDDLPPEIRDRRFETSLAGHYAASSSPARLSATAPAAGQPAGIVLGPLMIDSAAFTVRRSGKEIPLTVTEFRLLYELARHAGQVLTRDQLLELVWGYSYLGDSRLVDVHVQRLRTKVEEDPSHPVLILTVRGVGYRASRSDQHPGD
jgi:two-component system, OmpR family, response regulator MtrA